jgi:outer membrane protein
MNVFYTERMASSPLATGAIALALVSVTGSSARAEPRTPITLAQVLGAVPRAPAALIAPHDIVAAEASVDAARAWPATAVHLATNRLTARLVLGATIPLPIFGTIGAARRSARAAADVVRADADVTRRDLRHRAVLAWIQLSRAGGDVEVTTVAAQQAAELQRIANGRLGAGVGADVDLTVATAARARADVEVTAAQHLEDAASAELAGLLGWDPARALRAVGLPPTDRDLGAGQLRARMTSHPEHVTAARRVDAAAAEADAIAVQWYPLVALEGSVSIDDPSLDQVGMNSSLWQRTDASVGIAFELPLFAHIGDKQDAARATEAAQRARLVAVDTDLGAALQASYERWRAANDRLRALEGDVAPAQEKAAKLSAQAYREGARDLASALQAARDLAAVHAEINAARAEAAVALADLQLAAGQEVGDVR